MLDKTVCQGDSKSGESSPVKTSTVMVAILGGLAATCRAQDTEHANKPASVKNAPGTAGNHRFLADRVKTLGRRCTDGFVDPHADLAYGKRMNGPRNLQTIDLGWAYNYAVLEALGNPSHDR